MTFLEKLKEDNPKMKIPEDCRGIGCPKDRGYEIDKPVCRRMGAADHCKKCWNREMPNTEAIEYCDKCGYIKEQCECEEDVSFADDLLNQGYNKGLNDGRNEVWDCLKRATQYAYTEKLDIFGETSLSEIVNNITPQEALAKLKPMRKHRLKWEMWLKDK